MFVPGLTGYSATENGHRNYQSPARGSADFGPHVDRFSAWLIYLSLVALSAEPALWSTLHEPDGEFLLLREDDLTRPAASVAFTRLLRHSDRTVRNLAEQVRSLLGQPLDTLPALVAGPRNSGVDTAGTTAAGRATGSNTGPGGPGRATAGNGLPPWLPTHLISTASVGTSQPPDGPNPATPRPSSFPVAPTNVGFAGRRAADQLNLAALLLLLALFPTMLLRLGPAGGVISGMLLAGFVGLLGWGRHRRPEFAASRDHLRQVHERLAHARDADDEIALLLRERDDLDRAEADRARALASTRQEITDRHNRTLRGNETAKTIRLQPIHQELTTLGSRQAAEVSQILATLRSDHVQRRLRSSVIGKAGLSGLGATTIASLAACGIHTAADFVDMRLLAPSGPAGYISAELRTANGAYVKVPQIGPKRAETLIDWRHSLVNQANRSVPTQLSPADLRAIAHRFQQRRELLTRERAKVEQNTENLNRTAVRWIEGERQRLNLADQDARDKAAKARADIDMRLDQTRRGRPDTQALALALADARRLARSHSLSRYLRFLVTGT